MKRSIELASAALLTFASTGCVYQPVKLESCLSRDQVPQTDWRSGKIERRFYAFAGMESAFGSGNISDARYHAAYCAKNFPNSSYELIRINEWQRHAARIALDVKEERHIIFFGHSLGCREALDAAKCLEGENTRVSMIFLDAFSLAQPIVAIGHQQTIPKNVDWVLNYSSAYGPFSGPREIELNLLDSPDTKVESFLFNTTHTGFFGEPYLAACAQDIGRMIGIVPGKEPLYPLPDNLDNQIVQGLKENPR